MKKLLFSIFCLFNLNLAEAQTVPDYVPVLDTVEGVTVDLNQPAAYSYITVNFKRSADGKGVMSNPSIPAPFEMYLNRCDVSLAKGKLCNVMIRVPKVIEGSPSPGRQYSQILSGLDSGDVTVKVKVISKTIAPELLNPLFNFDPGSDIDVSFES